MKVGKSLPVHRTLPDHVHYRDLKEPADVISLMCLFDRFIAGGRMESQNHRIILGLLTLSSTPAFTWLYFQTPEEHLHIF